MCIYTPISFKSRISVPYQRLRKNIFELPRPILLANFPPEMMDDWKYLKKNICSNKDCGHDECLFIRGILEEIKTN